MGLAAVVDASRGDLGPKPIIALKVVLAAKGWTLGLLLTASSPICVRITRVAPTSADAS